MKPLADRITEQLQAHRFGQSAKELATTLGSTSDHVWQQLKALQLAGLVARRDVGRDTVWHINKEQTAMSIPNQVEQRLKAAGLNGMTSLQLKNFLKAESKSGVDAALQFFKRKGQVALINDRWVWVTQEEATAVANDTAPASTELLRQVLAEDKPALQVVATQPAPAAAKAEEPVSFNCLLDAAGQLHLDMEDGSLVTLSAANALRLARFLQAVTPVISELAA
jgi:hypothetical protein